MRIAAVSAAGAAALLCLPQVATAQVAAPGEWRLTEENDFFNKFTEQTDRYYTQGIRIEHLSPPRSQDADFVPGITVSDLCALLCGHGDAPIAVNTGYAFGQNIYTPANISIAAPQPFDRPWAGLLYGTRVARIRYVDESLAAQREDRLELTLGVVGPASLAKQVQTEWHKIIGVGLPKGWNNQLRNEPVVQLRYESAFRWPREEGGIADVIPRVRANLGNALVSMEAEVTARIGWNLSGFGAGAIQGTIPMAPSRSASSMAGNPSALAGRKFLSSANLFVRGGIKAVARNMFLDGNTFASNDIRINRTLFVPEVAAGIEANLVGNFWLSYQFVHRGSEFESRLGGKAPAQQFGSVTLAFTTGL